MNLPHVTEILRCFTGIYHIPHEILTNAASRGTQVHAICAGIAKGAWITDEMIPEELKGYVDSFRLWKESTVQSFDIIETRYSSDVLGYTGQIDFVIEGYDGERYLVDIKTSASKQKTYPLQLAAYEQLLNKDEIHVKSSILVYLKKNGSYPLIQVIEDSQHNQFIFTCALACYHYFHKEKTNGKRAA